MQKQMVHHPVGLCIVSTYITFARKREDPLGILSFSILMMGHELSKYDMVKFLIQITEILYNRCTLQQLTVSLPKRDTRRCLFSSSAYSATAANLHTNTEHFLTEYAAFFALYPKSPLRFTSSPTSCDFSAILLPTSCVSTAFANRICYDWAMLMGRRRITAAVASSCALSQPFSRI